MRKPLLADRGCVRASGFPPSQLSTSGGAVGGGGSGLQSWHQALSLDLPIGTPRKSGDLRRGGLRSSSTRPLAHTLPPRTLRHRGPPGAARTPRPGLRAPRAQPPGPFRGTRSPARRRGSRWRLLRLGSRPPDAARSSRRSLPPSQLLRRDPRGARRARSSADLGWGGSWAPGGAPKPQASGEKAAEELAGRGQCDCALPPSHPTPTPALSFRTSTTPPRRALGLRWTGAPLGPRGTAAQPPGGGALHPGAGRRAGSAGASRPRPLKAVSA